MPDDKNIQISEGVTFSGDNAEEVVRRWLGSPRKDRRRGGDDEGIEWCRSTQDHQFYFKFGRHVNGRYESCYECEKCGRKVYI